MSKPAPGPYVASFNSHPKCMRWEIWAKPKDSFSRWVCNMKMGEAPIEEEPTARLMAAAPELLEASKAALSLFSDDGSQGGTKWTLDALKGAIAKAEGREP